MFKQSLDTHLPDTGSRAPILQALQRQFNKFKPGSHAPVPASLARPENPIKLARELRRARRLGSTRDGQCIYLCRWQQTSVMRELGRLRELTFREVGEGTGRRRDLDAYDRDYEHLILWDSRRLTIAGAYRLGVTSELLERRGPGGFYTASLFDLRPALNEHLSQALELGRSFVKPEYWGKASLDYLWQGLGAYLRQRPDIRYLLGPVSLSADCPQPLTDWLVTYYRRYYAPARALADARRPHFIDPQTQMHLNGQLASLDREQGLALMLDRFREAGYPFPTLFKHYPAVYAEGGYQLLAFSRDSQFGNCLDGLFLGDLQRMKPAKAKRYLGR